MPTDDSRRTTQQLMRIAGGRTIALTVRAPIGETRKPARTIEITRGD
ncbi:hypothetical protein [Streptomyces rubellomurinus]|uniref:Uncharacterized protein n=1 Tax=Streptomyces sp. Y1 TaxID=3238634 RepID=A0AB39TWT5_9ACTN|nr:hypothetical protein [Streptomyces rubellomurinus]